ncbi:MAG: QueT transporter family protein [Bacillota bacterium]|jgi:uncharacterized membrane protein
MRYWTRAAIISAVYVAVTAAFSPVSFGPVQFRVAESLALLPFLWAEAIPGLFVGCLLANTFWGLGTVDIVLGSLATLLAAALTRRMPNIWLAALPPVVVNALIVGAYLTLWYPVPLGWSMVYVGLGQIAACFALGIPLATVLRRLERRLTGRQNL